MAKGCWITSSPGASLVTLDALPGNGWPEELRGRGFRVLECLRLAVVD